MIKNNQTVVTTDNQQQGFSNNNNNNNNNKRQGGPATMIKPYTRLQTRRIFNNTITTNAVINPNRRNMFLPKAMYRKKFFRNNIGLNLKRHCFIYIKQTFNNTFVTVKNKKKKLLLTKSCGAIGFRGKKRSAYYASIQLAKRVRTLIRKIKKTATVILLSKPTKHVKLIISNLSNKFDLKIKEIVERIPVTHNGLRKSHVRRK